MRAFAAFAVACAILLTQAASAATTPKISGVYDLMLTTVCQASVPAKLTTVVVPGPNNSFVTTDIETIDPNESLNTGSLNQVSGTATFSGSNVTLIGTQSSGDLVFTGTAYGTTPGLTSQSVSTTDTYTNTATQLTLTGSSGGFVYQVLYSGIVRGVAQRADLVRVDTVNGCIEQGTAVHQ